MKFGSILLTLLLCFITEAYADSVAVEVKPAYPVAGENFLLVFRIETAKNDVPEISFDPGNATVIDRRGQGVSTQTTIINGQLSSKREVNFVYEVVVDKPVQQRFSNIVVNIGGSKLTHKDVVVNVLKEPKEMPEMYLEAEVNKNTLYVGEALNVRYYLFTKVNIMGDEFEKFPVFQHFIKRFKNVIDRTQERVQVGNEIFLRALKYEAILYPEKTGELKVDPLKLRVQFSKRSNDPFGVFGMNMRNLDIKTLTSKPVSIKVLPLPSENVPKDFTGLVGKHDFTVSVNRSKLLVNEAAEVKLSISGPGALENYEGPKIYQDPALETFDTKYDLTVNPDLTARKDYEYTFLARGPLNMPEKKLTLSFFDPDQRAYVQVEKNLPGLEIVGSGAPAAAPALNSNSSSLGTNPDSSLLNPTPNQMSAKREDLTYMAPPFFNPPKANLLSLTTLNIVLGFGLVLILGLMGLGLWKERLPPSDLAHLIRQIQDHGMNYPTFHKLLQEIPHESHVQEGHGTDREIILKSALSPESKEYFLKLLDECLGKLYAKDQQAELTKDLTLKVDKKYLKEFLSTYGQKKHATVSPDYSSTP